jgi:cellulose synthase/poly-beta-1,6-N-acetylglucosamine synthase-like glycosyltransferase
MAPSPISVVIPLFDKGRTVGRALRSVLAQPAPDLDVVVVDDGSTDDGPTAVEALGDPRVRLVRQRNQGVSAARNRGVAEARHELVAFLDADDEWLHGFLGAISALAERHPECGLYATRYLVAAAGRQRPAVLRGMPDRFAGVLDDYFRLAARSEPPICSSAVCVRKAALVALGLFPTGVAAGEDLLTWARLAGHHPVAYSASCEAVVHAEERPGPGFKPPRTAVDDDRVGAALEELARTAPRATPALRSYRAMWYRIRAATYTAWGERSAARTYALRGLRCHLEPKLLAYLAASFLPRALAASLMTALRAR